jgi:hypothetical protein
VTASRVCTLPCAHTRNTSYRQTNSGSPGCRIWRSRCARCCRVPQWRTPCLHNNKHSEIPVRSATRNRHGKKAQDSHISSNAHAAKVSRAIIRRNTKPGQESASIIIHPYEARKTSPAQFAQTADTPLPHCTTSTTVLITLLRPLTSMGPESAGHRLCNWSAVRPTVCIRIMLGECTVHSDKKRTDAAAQT